MRNYIPVFTDEETDNVLKKLKPSNSKACNDNLLWGSATSQAYSGKYHGYSFKRSNLYKVAFSSAEFDHCNFTGSILKEVIFESTCNFSSVNFQRSILDGCSFNSEETMHALNFSACILDNVDFSNNTIRGSYFNNAKINNCRFNNTVIRSTSFDNCIIKNSSFLNCNMKNLNLEFSTFINVDLENAQISFYQLPYIIGIFNEPNRLKNLLIGCGEGKTINFSDYVHNIQDSIVYFTNKNQFLPLANLYYLKGDYNIAKNCILSGVENSLLRNDYTLIKYLIKLAIILKLLDYSEINHLLNKVDLHLNKIKDDENYTYYLLQSFEMQQEVQNNFDSSVLKFKIDTTLDSSKFNEASNICQEIDDLISTSNLKINHSFSLSHNSPISIVLTAIGAVADLITISSIIYKLIEKKFNKKRILPIQVKETFEQYNSHFLNEMGDRIDNLKELLNRTTKNKQNKVIEDFKIKMLASFGEIMDINLSLITTQ